MACSHVEDVVRLPKASDNVYREDCTQCFDSIDDAEGLDVCLTCFNGGCQRHSPLHHGRTHHPLVVNIKRTRKATKRDEPPPKISKLAIAAEKEEDRYDTRTRVRCFDCGDVPSDEGKLDEVVKAILGANTFARAAEVQAWEQEFVPCEHTLCLQQETSRQIESQALGHCSKCDMKENLWLCLECGNLGCGRAQFGGIGGHGHALEHNAELHHPVAVKLGSLTPEGTADVYCYACNEERVDPELATHLRHWHINIADRQKTEKSLTEIQIEHNLSYDFSMTTEDGKTLSPLFGEGFTGLKNLGNSCYLASIVQSLFAMPAFQQRYNFPDGVPPAVSKPAEDLETQLQKLANGLLSGRYSHPDHDEPSADQSHAPHQKGLAPAMLKHLVGKGHEEFSTMRQQDAFEFLLHLLKLITRSLHTPPLVDPVTSFRFVVEQRLQCTNCKKVRLRDDEQENISIPVPARRKPRQETKDTGTQTQDEFQAVTLEECLDIFTGTETVELKCPACEHNTFTKRTLFKTFPQTLVINVRRFELVNWVPTKLDIPVVVSDEGINLDAYFSPGLQDDEILLPDEVESAENTAFKANEAALSQLEAMGFPRPRCEKALHATGNSDAEAAMNWLFAHMEDPDIDEPLQLASPAGAATGGVNPESIETLGAMGIAPAQARKALIETGGDVNRALDWVFSHPDDPGDTGNDDSAAATSGAPDSTEPAAPRALAGSAARPANFNLQSIVCHKGASIHAGHYVAFVRKGVPGETSPQWVLFNDEKVVLGADAEEMKKFAYIYFLQRA